MLNIEPPYDIVQSQVLKTLAKSAKLREGVGRLAEGVEVEAHVITHESLIA